MLFRSLLGGSRDETLNALSNAWLDGQPLALFRRGEAGAEIIADALALQEAGVFALVLELVPQELAGEISKKLSIPVIGIGAGNQCDAQVLVITDLLGLTKSAPKLAKAYRNLRQELFAATQEFAQEVQSGKFPSENQTFH